MLARKHDGWAISQCLPTNEFERLTFMDEQELQQRIEKLPHSPDDNEYGYLIECNFEYPAETKQITEEFPLCPF